MARLNELRNKSARGGIHMRSIKQKLSIILVLVLLVNILLPGMNALAAEANNSVAPSELGNASDEYTLLSPDTINWENQNSTQQLNGNLRSQVNSNSPSFMDAEEPTRQPIRTVESPNPPDKLPDSSDSKVKIQGARTAIIKAAIRVLVRY